MQKTRFLRIGKYLPIHSNFINWSFLMRVSTCVIVNILFVANLLVASPGHGQSASSKLIDLELSNTVLKKAFKVIENKADVVIMYKLTPKTINERVEIKVTQTSLADILNLLLKDKNLKWTIRENVIRIEEGSETTAIPVEHLSTPMFSHPPVTVRGRVVDQDGKPLAGTSVTIKKSSLSTVADLMGHFTLEAKEGDILLFSYIGYQTKEVKVNAEMLSADHPFLFALSILTAQLDTTEVIVNTGYRQLQRARVTGASTVVTREKYDQRVAVTGNFLENLEGKVPGLLYNPQTNEFAIRGVSTFDAVKQPLIVIDGFPTEIDFRSINPNDIVSVNVLRDAAAASIYGARASNGVIVIETRRGKSGQPVFSFRGTSGFQSGPDFNDLKLANSNEFLDIEKDYTLYSGDFRFFYDLFGAPVSEVQDAVFDFREEQISESEMNERIRSLGNYDNLKDTRKLFYRNRMAQQVDFDFSGGDEKNTYLLGVNYMNEISQVAKSDNNRILLNFATTHKLNKRLTFDFRGVYTNSTFNSPFADPNSTVDYTSYFPYEKLVDAEGNPLAVQFGEFRNQFAGITTANNEFNKSIGLYDQLYYPYGEIFANSATTKLSSIRFQGRLTAKLKHWLSFEAGGAYEDQPGTQDILQSEQSFNLRRIVNFKANRDDVTGLPIFNDLPKGSMLTRTNQKTNNYTVRAQFNINHHSNNGKHAISGIVGTESRKTVSSAYTNTFFGYDGATLIVKPVNIQSINEYAAPAFPTVDNLVRATIRFDDLFNERYDDRRFISFYSEGNYQLNERYGLSGSLRFDKSNLFGTDPKFRNRPFYSIGVNWRAKKEPFLQESTVVDDLKLRAAYGLNGNIPTSNNGPFLILQSQLNTYLNPPQVAYDVLAPENTSLRWEKTTNLNFGADYSLLSGRIWGALDFYSKRSSDVFGTYSADPTLGFNEYNANTSSILNKGVELAFNTINIRTSKFKWETQLTASWNRNKVIDVKNNVQAQTNQPLISILRISKDYPIDALFGYKYAGLNELGQPTIYDKEGKPTILTATSNIADVSIDDLKYMGTTTPQYVVGLNNQFSMGNFSVSLLFMYYGGHMTRVQAPDPYQVLNGRVLQGASQYWKESGDEAITQVPGFPEYGTPGYYEYTTRESYTYADRFVRRADFIRLRDLIITYSPQSRFLNNIGLKRPQIRAQVQNAFRYTFSGNDIDPDAIDRRTGLRRLAQQPFFSLSLYTTF